MTCRDCELFDLESAKDKRGRVRKTWPVRCFWTPTEQYPMSAGCANKPLLELVTSEDGKRCPCFQKRVV
jgi:hypothetical protein